MYNNVSWDCIHITDNKAIDELSVDTEGVITLHYDCKAVVSKNEFIAKIADIFKFPDYFGANWDALLDCLCDTSAWMPAKGYVLVIHNADYFIRNLTMEYGMFNEVWLDAAEFHAGANISFHLIYVVERSSS